jgi:hypothetical protein
VATATCVAAEFLRDKLKDRHESFLTWASLYNNQGIHGLGVGQYSRVKNGEQLKWNVIAACVDTAT